MEFLLLTSKSVNMMDLSPCDSKLKCQTVELQIFDSWGLTPNPSVYCACLTTQKDFLLSNSVVLELYWCYVFCRGFFHSASNSSQLPEWEKDFLTHINLRPSFHKEPTQRLTKTAAQTTWFSFCCYTTCGFHFISIGSTVHRLPPVSLIWEDESI